MENEEFKLGKVTLIKRLPVVKVPAPKNNRGYKYIVKAMYLCFCGKEFISNMSTVNNGTTKSCGCYKSWKNGKSCFIDHRSKKRLYRLFHDMKKRCYNKNNSHYKYYGGKGIKICQEWLEDFLKFEEWALNNGYEPHLTIDRKHNDKDYTPDNCRWVTKQIQAINRGMFKKNTSGYRGVSRAETVKEGWRASIRSNGKLYQLGTYSTKELAAEAYNKKATELFGLEAKLNKIIYPSPEELGNS